MLTSTSFKSIKTQVQIFVAMRRSMIKGFSTVQFITNKKGENYLRVERVAGKVVNAFKFTDKAGRDVSKAVYKGLKSAA